VSFVDFQLRSENAVETRSFSSGCQQALLARRLCFIATLSQAMSDEQSTNPVKPTLFIGVGAKPQLVFGFGLAGTRCDGARSWLPKLRHT